MENDLWKKIQILYHAPLLQPIEQRAEFLAGACGDDLELRREVESLLDQNPDSFLENSPLHSSGIHPEDPGAKLTIPSDSPLDQTQDPFGQHASLIGPYRLLEVVGRGGMGEVWLAEQTQPLRRRVAIKLVKTGMHSSEVVARFEYERQALALMDHPAIAKVFDAGSTAEGRPYFVMEFVSGLPITGYCEAHKLITRERLEFFILVCEAVQHAHERTIIHRDLKPSNILTAEVDGRPLPRIIDFGIAKATSQKVAESFTRVGALLGTVDYMSPEQAALVGENVDTRTDLYSLGIILYELLVGERPFDFREMV